MKEEKEKAKKEDQSPRKFRRGDFIECDASSSLG
jgi:hypothetical protein